ncbi:MAG TPA: glycerophosphodiester phosphodiesterase family protein [Draconibacterium sp.]|nr:glycerophosphodiester phosphodiesterase family protein [Draconibacterium sp.]
MKMNLNFKPFFSLQVLILLFSEFLFSQNSTIIHELRKPNNKIYVIAHRGAHQGIPENSLPAYQKAIDLGCDFVEIDIRTTKDGKFVSVHNSTIDNYTTGKKGSVKDLTLAELKSVDIGEKLGEEWKNTRIPTFEEILQLCRGKIGIYLDLKDAPVAELMKIIGKFDMEKDIIWYIPYRYLLETENTDTIFGSTFIMPDPQSEKNLEPMFKKFKAAIVATDMGELSEHFVNAAHVNGAKVFVDEKEGTIVEWQKIIGWKTDGIQTDNPAGLIEFLNQK